MFGKDWLPLSKANPPMSPVNSIFLSPHRGFWSFEYLVLFVWLKSLSTQKLCHLQLNVLKCFYSRNNFLMYVPRLATALWPFLYTTLNMSSYISSLTHCYLISVSFPQNGLTEMILAKSPMS